MWKVDVESEAIESKSGVSARTGRPYAIREQEVWCYTYGPDAKAHKHAQRVRLALRDEQPPYPPGVYFVHPGSLYLDRWGQLSVKASLMPAAEYEAWLRAHVVALSARPASPAAVGRAA